MFLLVDRGREIGRIRGYPGPEGFWMQLAMLMDRLPKSDAERDDSKALHGPD